MALFDDKITAQLTELIGDIPQKLTIQYFRQTVCASCDDTQTFVKEIAAMNENISVVVNDLDDSPEVFQAFDVDRTPAIAMVTEDGTDHGIRFFGIPAGYEINSFVASIREVGGMDEPLPDDLVKRIKAIDKDVHIKVFVTPTCPHCPGPVILGHRLALMNKHIKTDMIEATTFPDLAQKYSVRGVPKIVINETEEFVGSQPIQKFLEVIEGL